MSKYVEIESVLRIIENIKLNKDVPKNYGTLLDIERYIRELPTINIPVVQETDTKDNPESKTHFDELKEMNVDVLAITLFKIADETCYFCKFRNNDMCVSKGEGCIAGIKKWLESEF